MWLSIRGNKRECEAVRDALERSTGERETHEGWFDNLLARLPENERRHVGQCNDCRTFASELVEVREMFAREDSGAEPGAQPGPYFLARVMATIAERETTLEKSAQIWAAVPRLAHRLTVLASLTLLIAGSWLYEQPKHNVNVSVMSAEQSPEGLVEGSTTTVPDDFLLNVADR
ncbi:MAG TPA: hypothetical protein VIW23_15860 [Candidatus Acidoferrum sp.]|jgi:hypothetical protein